MVKFDAFEGAGRTLLRKPKLEENFPNLIQLGNISTFNFFCKLKGETVLFPGKVRNRSRVLS